MMKLVDLKRSKKEKSEEAAENAPVAASQPDYAWGLKIHLEQEELEKLGITELPPAGTEFHLMGVATVTGSRIEDYGDRKEKNVDLQITMLTLSEEAMHMNESKESASAERKEFKKAASALNPYRGM